MAPLINTQNVTHSFGATPLFRRVSMSIGEGQRLGLIGPNGSGKSTLLEILAGRREPDAGEIAVRKGVRIAYVAQDSSFPDGKSVREIIRDALRAAGVPEDEQLAREAESLGRAGFSDFDAEASSLSGGWRKRLAIAEALVRNPDVLLLDEPTNHLDLFGIEWLEKLLKSARFACVVVSHDRYFLENVATDVAELNRAYPDGLLQVKGIYSRFLEAKEEFLAAQAKQQDALANRVRTEIEWLRRGPKARATKAKARIDRAHQMIGELADLTGRSRTASAGIDFSATERKTKRLIELERVSFSYEDRKILNDVNFTLTGGTRVGLVGPNGSGKTTLLRLLRGELEPDSGEIRKADALRIVYFQQIRQLDADTSLRRALAPDGDSVVYQGRTIHVASWAARFLFSNEQLNQPVGKLSGGERARVLIARLMIEPADILLMDEPTNDLDIPTLEILEESLLEFPGALILITHDRYLLDRVVTTVLGLDGKGETATFADYSQWETWLEEQEQQQTKTAARLQPAAAPAPPTTSKKKLSYLENREYESLEQRISAAEGLLAQKRAALENPNITSNPALLQTAVQELESAEQSVDELYARWAELEEKIGS